MGSRVVFDEESFRDAVASNLSIAGTITTMGWALAGASYSRVRKEVIRMNIDTSHWMSQGCGGGRPRKNLDNVFVKGPSMCRGAIKRRFMKDGFVENKCAICHLPSTWQDQPLVMRLDHINGVRDDNRIENLRLICPNCDSQLPTYCGRNIQGPPTLRPRKPLAKCSVCGSPIKTVRKEDGMCKACNNIVHALARKESGSACKILWPDMEDLMGKIQKSSVNTVAKELGVSSTAVHKHIKARMGKWHTQGT